MCNSSIQGNDSVSTFKEILQWHCMCEGRFGSLVINSLTGLYFFVGTPISCWSLWVFLHRNMARNLFFSINIAVLELFSCFICVFDLIIANTISLPNYKLIVIFVGLHWTVRPLLQIFLCLEHYVAVVHPVTFLRYNSIQYRVALAAASWIIALVNSLRLIFIETPLYPDHLFFVLFCIAVMIISFCCLSVLRALKHPGPRDRKSVEMNQQKRKAFRVISHILLSILVCFVPQVIAFFMLIVEISSQFYVCTAFPIILTFTLITIIFSPLIRMYSEGHMKDIMCFSPKNQAK